jgi:hypothetical protein
MTARTIVVLALVAVAVVLAGCVPEASDAAAGVPRRG